MVPALWLIRCAIQASGIQVNLTLLLSERFFSIAVLLGRHVDGIGIRLTDWLETQTHKQSRNPLRDELLRLKYIFIK